jgi:Na+/H+ antiporter NhaD/arsenite permease-like protein
MPTITSEKSEVSARIASPRDRLPTVLWAAAGITLHGGLIVRLVFGSALACAVNNLPAAAALHPAGTAGLWAAILATAIGPGLVLTGSVATLICRRIARDAGAALNAMQFTAIGAVLVPTQLAAAVAGLHLTGALR